MHQTVQILDFGSQYTQLIARRLREASVYCEIRPCTEAAPVTWPAHWVGLILSGGPASVVSADAPAFDSRWLEAPCPLLGVCYGMQLIAQRAGGRVLQGAAREYGLAAVDVLVPSDPLLGALSDPTVWMSHGDHVEEAPPGFEVVARSGQVVAAFRRSDRPWWGLQFHPEVSHSRAGAKLLSAFLEVCGANGDWSPGSFISDSVRALREQLGEDQVLCALSGGVDSAVVASLLREAIGDRLHCVFVDNGLLREGEADSVRREFADFNLKVVDATERFLTALAGVTDPEIKRKIIGETFIRVFEAEAADLGPAVKWLAQGTLYPDVIESVSVRGPSAKIKSHHNVGGLPERMAFKLVEPLRELFKDEARAVGLALGLSEGRVWRHPFPGPGLAVRCLGQVTPVRLAALRKADAIFLQELHAAGWMRKIWQAFCVLLPVRSVGVMGDERSYEEALVLRAVHSTDGMTADVVALPWDLLQRCATRIINEVPGVNRVTYDLSSKPPGTIEWE